MQEISFTSAIRPVSIETYTKQISKIGEKYSVKFPWTMNESVKAPVAYTKNICDCTMLGITDGENVFIMHLNPETKLNHSLYYLKNHVAQNINPKKLSNHAILIGSKNTKKSQDIYMKLVEILKYFNIPFSELKIANNPLHVAYKTSDDEWIITSSTINKLLKNKIDNKFLINKIFKKVNINKGDHIYETPPCME